VACTFKSQTGVSMIQGAVVEWYVSDGESVREVSRSTS